MTELAPGITIDPPVYNAAGCYDWDLECLTSLAESQSGAIQLKTSTWQPCPGNEGRTWYTEPGICSINSIGLKNPGTCANIEMVKTLKCKYQKPVIASFNAGDPDLNQSIEACVRVGLAFELNVSCPNVGNSILGYDIFKLSELLDEIKDWFSLHNETAYQTFKMGLKLPAYLDHSKIYAVALVLKKYPFVHFVVCCNTIPGLVYDDIGETAITPNNGIGGISGPAIKPVALANVYHFSKAFERYEMPTKIVGCGGIMYSYDIEEYMRAGAHFCQVGTALIEKGPSIFADICQ